MKIGRRWGIPALSGRVAETGRTGWYCRVMQEGWVEPGLPGELIDRTDLEVTVALVNDFGRAAIGISRWHEELPSARCSRNGGSASSFRGQREVDEGLGVQIRLTLLPGAWRTAAAS